MGLSDRDYMRSSDRGDDEMRCSIRPPIWMWVFVIVVIAAILIRVLR